MRLTSIRFPLILCIVIAVAYAAAVGVNAIVRSNKAKQVRLESTTYALKHAKDIAVGRQIADAYFYNLDNDSILLSSLLTQRKTLLFMDGECPTCLVELKEFAQSRTEDEICSQVALVFTGNYDPLVDTAVARNVGCPILLDTGTHFARRHMLSVLPFALTLDNNLTVRHALAGAVHADEIEDF